MLTKEQRDRLNALKSRLSTLKNVKLSKTTDAERIAELEREIRKITNPADKINMETYIENAKKHLKL